MLAKKKLSVMMLSMAFASQALAGLGGIAVRSNLGEPLRAEIDFSGNDSDLLRVGLASQDTFKDLKVDYTGVLNSLRFTLAQRSNGRSYIRVTSNIPVSDPYLRFVVEARMPSGRSIREYTVLLDPADYDVPVPVPGRGVTTTPVFVPELPKSTPVPPGRSTSSAAARPAVDSVQVRPGQTLQQIAAGLAMPGATVRQIMAALVQANPSAFIGGDPARIKSGARLNVPTATRAAGLTRQQVDTLLGGAPTQAAMPSDKVKAPSADTVVKPEAKPAEKVADPVAKPAEQVVKLEPVPEAASLPHAESSAAANEQALLLQQAQKKITELEERLRALQAASASKAAIPEPESAETSPSLLDQAMPWLPAIGAGLAAILLGAAGLILYRRRKKTAAHPLGAVGAMLDQSSVERQNQEAVAGGNTFLTDFTRTDMPASEEGDVDPIAEAEVYLAYGRDQQAEEILKDALAKDPTRHEVRAKLLEIYASRQDRVSFEQHAKQLHAAMDGQGALWDKVAKSGRGIDPANPLYGVVATGAMIPGDIAEASAELGAVDIDLDSELMGGEAEPVAPVTESGGQADIDDDLLRSALLGDEEPVVAPPPVEDLISSDLDLDALLDDKPGESAPDAAPEDKHMLDFDFHLDDLPAAEEKAAPAQSDDNAVDFDFALDMPASQETPSPEPALTQPVSTEGMSVSDDPLATRLDLARVYLDMGDKDGAREVLEDLVAEADGALKKEAESLLASL